MTSGSAAIFLTDSSATWEAANTFAADMTSRLHCLLGDSTEIVHVGATSIPGCLTKGDVDLVVRVGARDFPAARNTLDENFDKNSGSVRDDRFASYVADEKAFPLGIQLVVKGSRNDLFVAFRDRLLSDEKLRDSYNALKRRYADSGVDRYREAKADFIRNVLSEDAR